VNKIHDALLPNVPNLDLSCEDNGLLHRLAERGQGPVLRLEAEAERLPPVPAMNVIAEIRGSELPNEYVLLSAHFDSWDSASGATDNGTATVMMMETMRILSAVAPNPRRTILVGHWGGEEQGLIGSGAFAEDHPEVVENIQFGMNQDNGTWRVEAIRMQGFSRAQESVDRWLRTMPADVSEGVLFTSPDSEGSSDHTSFTCRGAPVVRLQSNYPDYRQYTWHTNLDTFDKVILDDLRKNATLTAMLAYLASEEPERLSRERDPRLNANGNEIAYPPCGQVRRSGG
jgi:Zn-dependent M28 family amino/carboxypeptidase